LSGWRREVIQLSPGDFSGCVTEIGGCGLYAADEHLSHGLFHIGSAYSGGLTLGVARQRYGQPALWNGRPVDADTVLCVTDDAEMVFRSYDRCRVQWLFVPWKMLDEQVPLRVCLASQEEGAALAIRDESLAAKLRSFVAGVCRWSETVTNSPALAHDAFSSGHEEAVSIVREFICTYLAAVPSLGVKEVHAMRILRATRAYIRQNVGEAVSVGDLCDAAATSERTLRNACEIITGEPPMALLRAMRLNQVRRSILNADSPVSISRIGTRWGFLHMPQFSKDYRALFGELPSETVRRQLADTVPRAE
jgi:AraC family ethanolamine operon transcriptional activator